MLNLGERGLLLGQIIVNVHMVSGFKICPDGCVVRSLQNSLLPSSYVARRRVNGGTVQKGSPAEAGGQTSATTTRSRTWRGERLDCIKEQSVRRRTTGPAASRRRRSPSPESRQWSEWAAGGGGTSLIRADKVAAKAKVGNSSRPRL
jgi:hypothetical protein